MAIQETQVETLVKTTTTTAIKRPGLYDVVLFNDKKTPYDFVVLVLMHLFGKDYDSAVSITEVIQNQNRAVVGNYTYEIAITKRDDTVTTARSNGHPLRVEVEPSVHTGHDQ